MSIKENKDDVEKTSKVKWNLESLHILNECPWIVNMLLLKKKIGSGLKRISKEYLEMGNKVYIFVL